MGEREPKSTEPQRIRIFVGENEEVEVNFVFEGGSMLEIRAKGPTYALYHRELENPDALKEELLAQLPKIILPFLEASLTQLDYITSPTDDVIGEARMLDAEKQLKEKLTLAKQLEFTEEDLKDMGRELINHSALQPSTRTHLYGVFNGLVHSTYHPEEETKR